MPDMIPNPSQSGLITRDPLGNPIIGPTQTRVEAGRTGTSGGPFAVGQPMTTPPIPRKIATPMPFTKGGPS